MHNSTEIHNEDILSNNIFMYYTTGCFVRVCEGDTDLLLVFITAMWWVYVYSLTF